MSHSLAALRSDLAREMGLLISGTVSVTGTNIILIDTNRLWEYTETDAFRRTLLYIRTDAGGLGAAPEGEARLVIGYSGSLKMFTVLPQFSAAPAVGDIYELFLAPLELASWDLAVNLAIREAWPQVYKWKVHERPAAEPVKGLRTRGQRVEHDERRDAGHHGRAAVIPLGPNEARRRTDRAKHGPQRRPPENDQRIVDER